MWNDPDYITRLGELYAILNYRFRDPRLLCRALTHRSYVNENAHLGLEHNESLEFIGDSILNFIISTRLFELHPDRREGDFSRMRSRLVSGENLEKMARELRLGHFILLGRGEIKTGGAEKRNILGDAFEAIVASIYLDGGIRSARAFVLRRYRKALQMVDTVGWEAEDHKSRLQELVVERLFPVPRYVLAAEDGPPHERRFTVEVWVGAELAGQGMGKSKKEAQQLAAREALETWINREHPPSP
jgi:ribonuclease III